VIPALERATLRDLARKSGAERWALSEAELAAAIGSSVRRAFAGGEPSKREVDRYVASLHLEDLALAAACALGRDAAWEHFMLQHRPVLYRAADALDPSGGARELADSLYADLYGIRDDAEGRRSLFRYFHGRSSLATWLRAVLAQRYVDALRSRKRVEPLPENETIAEAAAVHGADPDRSLLVPLVERALRAAVNVLPPKDRLRLRSYYVSQLTLAEIGRITGEHEATVSRQLSRTRRVLREAIERHLREEAQLDDGQIARALELALNDPGAMDLQQALGADRKESAQDRSR
jgi:RNA polymerase sigma-70 factor (ECF subfamily)